jgi:hypothetical protein
MKYKTMFILVTFLIILIFFLTFIFLNFNLVSADHIVNKTGGGVNFSISEDTSTLFNISVNNTDAGVDANITEVNVTLWNFTYTSGTQGTSALGGFSNSTISNTSVVLTWRNTTLLISGGSAAQYFWFNATGDIPGVFNITVTTLNATGSFFRSNLTVTVNDTTSPVVTLTCTPNPLNIGEVLTCSCSALDDGDNNLSRSFTKNPPTLLDSGDYTTTCRSTDASNNTGIGTFIYTLSSGTSNPGFTTPTASSFFTKTINKGNTEFALGTVLSEALGRQHRVKVKVNGIAHYVGVVELSSSSSTINVSSIPQQAVFNIGDTNKFDVNNDTFYDLEVILNSINNNKANVTVKSIHEEISLINSGTGGSTPPVNDPVSTPLVNNSRTTGNADDESNLTWLWVTIWILFVVIITIIVIIIIAKGDKKTGKGPLDESFNQGNL